MVFPVLYVYIVYSSPGEGRIKRPIMNAAKNTVRNQLLRQERVQHNWRQQDVAEQIGTTVETVKRWERGYQQPSLYFRTKLCILFGKRAEELGLSSTFPSSSSSVDKVEPSIQAGLPQSLWTVPYPRNSHFTGREALLDHLSRLLTLGSSESSSHPRRAALSQPQAIKGLGGIGKTQIALEYAYRSRDQGTYTHILWVNASTEESIMASFLTIAQALPQIVASNETDQRKILAAILQWLHTCQDPWLMIVDNADDLALIQPYLPQQGQGCILVTTRATAVGWLAAPIDVDPMGLLEGTRFLLHRAQRLPATEEEYNEASNVVMTLDGFPLALDQAGAYIEETGCSIEDYLHLYEQHRTRLLARRGRQATNYPDSVATTWSLSFQTIENDHPAAAELLCLCAFLSPDHIPEELLTDAAMHWPSLLQQSVKDQISFNDLMEVLLAFSLVKRLVNERMLSLHRLVQAVQIDRIDPAEHQQWAERVVRAVHHLFPENPKEQTDRWPECLRYLEQVQACDALIKRFYMTFPEAAELLDRTGVYLREHATYGLAEPLFQQALAIAEENLGPEHQQVASTLNNLGILYWRQGRYELAESYLQRALKIREETLGHHHPQVAYPLNNLGLLYFTQGKYALAEPLLLQTINIWEEAYGLQYPQLIYPLNGLGALYVRQGAYALAEPHLQRALQIREETLGPDNPQVAYPLNNLSVLYLEQGKYELAEPLLQRALKIREQALGPDHPAVAYPLNNLGLLYRHQGKYAQAEALLEQALYIWEHSLGSDHSQVAEPLNELANIARDLGQYEKAETLYQRAFSLRQQTLGEQHLDFAETLHDWAMLREKQGSLSEALLFYQQALAIRESHLEDHHPKITDTRERLSAISQAMKQVEGGNDT
jgi:tetratricopeptide (TPR) repeat protein/transcriptional regulator with XRE-family HTH domain